MPVVMGTAGHIDHGKTTLIRTLTGTDCDRLEEEKRRGITIELGFAELSLPDGRSLSVVDVPGHEKFVRTMVAGASGVDFILLVIAADEGVMPQTREHLEICSLLGIRDGVVALTKTDAADAEMLELAREDLASFLAGTAFEGAPVIPVSARTGHGLDTLIAALAEVEARLAPVRSQDLFRLPIDRVFTLRGHGTVVTGTMIAGSVSVGDSVEIEPSGLRSKVRGLQSHGGAVKTALAGRRTAVNIPDLAVEQIQRGAVLTFPDTLFPAATWVINVTCLASAPRPLRHRAEVHFHHGSGETQARLYFADRDKLLPGDSCLCEVRFAEPLAAVFGDRCVIRSFSPLRTVAGAVVLNPLGVDMRRRSRAFAERCEQVLSLVPGSAPSDEAENSILTQLACTRDADKGLSFAKLRVLANLDSRALDKRLATLSGSQKVFCFDKEQRLYLSADILDQFCLSCEKAVADFHARHGERQGVARSEIISGWGKSLAPKLAHFVIERLIKKGVLIAEQDLLRLPAHSASFSKEQAPLSEAILAAHQQAGMTPPNLNEVLEAIGANKKEAAAVMNALRASGQLVRVAEGLWYAREHLDAVEAILQEWFQTHESIDLAGLKSVTGLSRKYLVALLEHFDARKITMRVGDVRVLR
ncbi:MAG: selenocysteine-specific translation elongation factor [Desulfovibrionaceae bacterium]|nr:selenocysteine-specific translation elongation factor [Desulfovibrionaceae bacterium]